MKQFFKRCWQAFKADGQLRFGVIGILVLLLIIILAKVLSPYDPYSYEFVRLLPPGSEGHPLGTNHMGQDMLSMLIYGVRTSLKVALISALISGALGVLIGGVGGFLGGWVDQVVSEIINIFLMIPTFFLILLIIALFGNSIANVMIVISQTMLGMAYMSGTGVEQDLDEARKWIRKAKKNGFSQADSILELIDQLEE